MHYDYNLHLWVHAVLMTLHKTLLISEGVQFFKLEPTTVKQSLFNKINIQKNR